MTRRVVGVLGGMGPEATILLQQRVLATVAAKDDADHLPLLIDMNPQVPSRIAHLIEGGGVDPGPTLAAMATRLEKAGATALAMPCNTAHHYAKYIKSAVSIPFLNMVEQAVSQAASTLKPGGRVGILASPAVRMADVFGPFLAQKGLSELWPLNGEEMLDAIRSIKANGPTADAQLILSRAADELAGQGADIVFVACSEFSLLSQNITTSVPLIDTVDVLAGAIRAHILQTGMKS